MIGSRGSRWKRQARLACLLAVITLPLLLVACGDDQPPSTPVFGQPTPTPDVQATIAALAQARDFGTPTPTSVPAADRELVLDFLKKHTAVSRDWDQAHVDFDVWRQGLIECDASSIQVTLRQFAGRFGGITEDARALPRSRIIRELTDQLIEAIEREEAAIRLLRDNWQPDDPTVFDDVDIERSAALALRKGVQDGISDLQRRTDLSSRRLVNSYSFAFAQLDSTWDTFHQDYDEFRARTGDLTLSDLVSQFRNVVALIRSLPTSESTRSVSQILAAAAEDEDLALRKLRTSLQGPEGASGEVPVNSEESFGDFSGFPGESTNSQDEVALFDAFDTRIVTTNAMRRQARQAFADALVVTSEENQANVEEFAEQYTLLTQSWDEFHTLYDGWRRSEGGCSRSKAIEFLGGFTLSFGEVANTVKGLPGATILRPVRELLVEAAEREERALRFLRNTWRPFDTSVYLLLDRERSTAGKLRRQVASRIQDLLAQYDISPQELSQ